MEATRARSGRPAEAHSPIVERILQFGTGRFLRGFVEKGRYTDLLKAMPVQVILNSKAALRGAGYYAAFVAHE